MRTKELEVQYHMARYERERKNAEAEAAKARQLQEQVRTFSKTESELRNQLNIYVEKFKQVRGRNRVPHAQPGSPGLIGQG